MASRSAAFAAAAVALSTAAGLVGLELAARFVFAKETDTALLRAKPQPPSVVPFVRRVPDPELLYDLKPGFRVIGWNGAKVETDASGCCRVVPGRRADEGPGPRVAILGDSSPFGWKVSAEETYAERLRPLLEKGRGPVAIRNFSVPGYNSRQHRVVLRDKALPWKPSLIVLHYDHNDSEPADDSRTGFMAPEFGDNPLHSRLLKLLARRWNRARSVRRALAAPDEPGNPERSLHGYRFAGPQFERHMGEMKKIADMAAAARVPVLVFLWNPWLTAQADPRKDPFYALLHEPVARRLRDMGFRVVDSYGPYQDYMRRERRRDLKSLWADGEDAHPNAAGHRLIAGVLAGEIIRLGLRPIP